MAPRSTNARRSGTTFVVVLLLLTLALAGVLAYQAHDAARSHRATAESALRDYAGFAAWEFGRHAGDGLWRTLHVMLGPVVHAETPLRPGALPTPAGVVADYRKLVERLGCDRTLVDPVRYHFRLDVRDGALVFAGAAPSPVERAWLADTLAAHVPELPRSAEDEIALLVDGGDSRIIAFAVVRDGADRPLAVYGFAAPAAGFAPIFRQVLEESALLPPSVAGDLPMDSILAIRVVDGAGRTVYRSPGEYSPELAAVDTLGWRYGGLAARASLRPEASSSLVIGGLPASRVPLVLGLLALAAGLVVAALFQLRREAELARLRADFVSDTSHELRTPLAQIRMFTETLLLGRVRSSAERRRSLEIVDREAKRLTQLVENALHFSRAERHATRVSPVPTPLATAVRETVEAFEPLARARDAELRLELDDRVVVPVDADAFRQILLNLLDNAAKYGPPGQAITIGLALSGESARLWVDDEGAGIPPRERERIWHAFSRLEREADGTAGGTGIGLAVVRELVTRHGGRTWVEDAAGGARFIVELPGAEARAGDSPGSIGIEPRDRAGTEPSDRAATARSKHLEAAS